MSHNVVSSGGAVFPTMVVGYHSRFPIKQRKEVTLETVELCAAEPWEPVPRQRSQSAQSKDTNVEKQSFHVLIWFQLNASCCICRKIHTYTEAPF